MKKKGLIVIGALLAVALVGFAAGCSTGGTGSIPVNTTGLQSINLGNQQEGIWVNGEGKVTVVPDIANLSLGIEAQEATVAAAQTKAADAMNQVMDVLTSNGVAKKDIQTQYFNITKVTRWDDKNQQEIVIGYRVSNIVNAKIRDIDKAGSIIDAVALAGGDLTRINSVSFSVDDPTKYYSDARQKAMADAKEKAEQLAQAAGVTLLKPTYINENSSSPIYLRAPVAYDAAGGVAKAPTPISPGETEITLTVQVIYAIR